jgi:hypothetical protein
MAQDPVMLSQLSQDGSTGDSTDVNGDGNGVLYSDMPVLKLFYGPRGRVIRRVHYAPSGSRGPEESERGSEEESRVTLSDLTDFIQARLYPTPPATPATASSPSALPKTEEGGNAGNVCQPMIRLRVGRPICAETDPSTHSQAAATDSFLPDLLLDSDDMLTSVVYSISQQVADLDLGSIHRDLVADLQSEGSQVDVDFAFGAMSSALKDTQSVLHLTVEELPRQGFR